MEVIGNHDMPYFEPFVGMGGVLQHVAINQSRDILACDLEKCIPEFWNEIKKGWKPSPITKEEYISIKKENKEDAEYAFAAFGCSFRGSKWTYFYNDCMNRAIKRITKKDYVNVMKDVTFLDHKSYIEHDPSGMLIYCDPPYLNSAFDKRRTNLINFDHNLFWDTMRSWSLKNTVIVSERNSPNDFKSIFSLNRPNGFNSDVITEHLFVFDK